MTENPEGAPFELERFELVLLKRPAERPEIPEAEVERFQALHLGHLGAMAAAGHLVIAGPFDQQPDESLRGLCLYQTGSLDRARALAEEDPAVRAGRFEVDVMYFYCEKDAVKRPALGGAATAARAG
ncbi:MAG TPA: YciI family protein [Acidimicrobiales bacterium]|jgi:uncharacterized protein YciI|nr:YciI family protein [Acidimicrobiales bacterium]